MKILSPAVQCQCITDNKIVRGLDVFWRVEGANCQPLNYLYNWYWLGWLGVFYVDCLMSKCLWCGICRFNITIELFITHKISYSEWRPEQCMASVAAFSVL